MPISAIAEAFDLPVARLLLTFQEAMRMSPPEIFVKGICAIYVEFYKTTANSMQELAK